MINLTELSFERGSARVAEKRQVVHGSRLTNLAFDNFLNLQLLLVPGQYFYCVKPFRIGLKKV